VKEETVLREPEAARTVHHVENAKTISSLVARDRNKLNAFLSKPESYAFSEKGREKVNYLLSIQSQYTASEVIELQRAVERWEAKMRKVGYR
jgi:hypothetical protein